MNSNQKTAGIAGLLYLMLIISGIFSLLYVPSKLIVWDNALATFNNITASESLFRFGIVSALFSNIIFILLPLVLYKLLKPINKTHALLIVIFALISVPISFGITLYKVDVLSLISDANYIMLFEADQLPTQVMILLESYSNGIRIVQIFWGLWLFPFGYLVYKSGFLPKILGIFLMIGCFGYLIESFGYSLFPDYGKMGISVFIGLPSAIGEFGICLWLLVRGVKN